MFNISPQLNLFCQNVPNMTLSHRSNYFELHVAMGSLHLSLSHPQPQPVEPQPNVFIVFISLNKSTKRP